MIVLDAQALEAFLVNEPAMHDVQMLIHSGEQVVISAISFGETADRMIRVHGTDSDYFSSIVEELPIHITEVDSFLALAAAGLRAVHYHRVRRPVSLADCAAAALALDRVARLATSDPHLIELVLEEGGLVEPLPGSDGTTWARR